MGKATGRVAESVAAGLLLYGAIWILQNQSVGMDLVNRVVAVVGALGLSWATPTWLAVGVLVATGIAVRLIAYWTRIPGGVGGDPLCAYSTLNTLGGLLFGAATVCGLLAGAMSVSMSGAWWGLPLLGVALVAGVRQFAKLSRGVSRIWSPAVF